MLLSRAKNMETSKIPTTVRKVRDTNGTKNPRMERKIHGTNRPWYEKSGSLYDRRSDGLELAAWRAQKSGVRFCDNLINRQRKQTFEFALFNNF